MIKKLNEKVKQIIEENISCIERGDFYSALIQALKMQVLGEFIDVMYDAGINVPTR